MALRPARDTENQRRRHVGARHGVPLQRLEGVIFGGVSMGLWPTRAHENPLAMRT